MNYAPGREPQGYFIMVDGVRPLSVKGRIRMFETRAKAERCAAFMNETLHLLGHRYEVKAFADYNW